MIGEGGYEALDTTGFAEESESKHTHAIVLSHEGWTKYIRGIPGRSSDMSMTWDYRRSLRPLYLGCAFWIFAVTVYLFDRQTNSITSRIWSYRQNATDAMGLSESPFTGAFSRFPRISALPERQTRMTIIGVWNGNSTPSYLRHFFYTMQLNADYLDLLMINRLPTPDDSCLELEQAGINVTWGGNIKFHCMDDKEWKRRHVDFLCSKEYGWDCNPTEYDDVTKEYQGRPDESNYTWRPFRGYIFRDLFANPDNPFWAWMDHDVFVGNFAHYPYNILSQLSIVSGSAVTPWGVYMAGQLTAFNLDDSALSTAWKNFPALKSAAHFTKYLEGPMPESSEERYWSYGYMRSDEDLPGTNLSYCIYPDIQGDDFYDGAWERQNSNLVYLISGREILLASTSYPRKEIEDLIQIERNDPIDNLGGLGWSGGEDGSGYLLDQPNLSSSEAKSLAISDAEKLQQSPRVHDGIVEDQLLLKNCTAKPTWKQCVDQHPLTITNPPIMRTTLIRFKEQQKGHIFRRLERDQRPRGYERKLIRHHLKSKKLPWWELPPFEITEDLVLRYNSDFVEVFRMGPSREETLFYRKKGEKSIG